MRVKIAIWALAIGLIVSALVGCEGSSEFVPKQRTQIERFLASKNAEFELVGDSVFVYVAGNKLADAGTLPAERIIGEHVRLGSSRAILARSFCNTQQITDYKEIEGIFQTGIPKIRAAEEHWRNCTAPEREENRYLVGKIVEQIVERM